MDSTVEIHFDSWTLRRQPRALFKDGTPIRLQDQPLQVLEELLTHPGEMVTREQLIARLWPKRIVDFDSALNAAVRRLRATLGDEAATPRYIETIPRHGYRFIGTVVRASPPLPVAADQPTPPRGEPSPHRRQWPVAAALLLVLGIAGIFWYMRDQQATSPPPVNPSPAQADQKSVAVLPFTDLSPEQDQQYFSDGLTEELLNILAQSRRLRVIARTSSFSFRGENADIPTVASKLNVTHVLEGSVRKSGDQVRITVQLIDAATSSHLWSQIYDRELDDIFEVQGDIAASVADALRVALGDDSRPGIPRNAQAYESFLRAKFFFQRRAPGDLPLARQYYEEALDTDPDFARAWAGLAGVFWIQTVDGDLERDTGLEKLRAAAERALSLDPELAEAHLRLSNYLWTVGDGNAAREHQKRATALDPNNPLLLGFRAGYAAANGRWEEAIELQRRVVAADPLIALNRGNLAFFLFLAGRLEEATDESSKTTELDPSRPNDILALVLISRRQFDEALRLVREWPESADRTQCLAFVYHGLGRKADADRQLEKLIANYGTNEPFRIAEVYAYRGATEEAFKWLQATTRLAPERRPSLARLSPFLRPLHTDARWDAWDASMR
jgi:TolB-like protein/DNA-binding winged helix-turn-helix (wHTH) protein/Tfp pilus assembly protein PilF